MTLAEASFQGKIRRIRERLTQPLPGWFAQSSMAPEYRHELVRNALQHSRGRHASVMILLFPKDGIPYVVLTVRRPDMTHHAGQISFPGGSLDDGEEYEEAALRETWEEVGVDPLSVEIIGSLTPLFIPPSDFWVFPFVGIVAERPDWEPHSGEVSVILEIPVQHLLEPENTREEIRNFGNEKRRVPYFAVGEYKVWGATAMMLAELLAVVKEAEKA